MNLKRDKTIDIIRGATLTIMIGGNMLPYMTPPHSFFYRYLVSFGAAVFITLASMMVYLSSISGKETFKGSYFFKRGIFLIFVAAAIDLLAHKMIPCVTFDILTFMGLSMPLSYLIIRHIRSDFILWMAILFFIFIPEFLYSLFPYRLEGPLPIISFMSTYPFISISDLEQLNFSSILKQWAIDGDFPFFPWFGYVLFGVLMGKWRFSHNSPIQTPLFIMAAFLLIVGGHWVFMENAGALHERDSFAELFYPPSIGLTLMTYGVIMMHFPVIDFLLRFKRVESLLSLFTIIGVVPVFVYFIHEMVIFNGIEGALSYLQIKTMDELLFNGVAFVHFLFIFLLCLLLKKMKLTWKPKSLFLKWFIGQ